MTGTMIRQLRFRGTTLLKGQRVEIQDVIDCPKWNRATRTFTPYPYATVILNGSAYAVPRNAVAIDPQ